MSEVTGDGGGSGSVSSDGSGVVGNGADSAGNAESWTSGFDEGTASYIQNKAWETPADVVTAYRELEKFRGVPADRLLTLPDPEVGKPEDWDAIYTKLGRPESPEGYEIAVENYDLDETRTNNFRQVAHAAGLTPTQVNALAKWDAEYGQGLVSRELEQRKASAKADVDGLRTEWGAAFEKHMGYIDAACNEFGIDNGVIQRLDIALGRGATMRFLSAIGSRLGEDTFEGGSRGDGGDKGFNAMTPAQADAKISELRKDAGFMKRYMKGDKDAVAQMDSLHRLKVTKG